jgi:hypothetical protein
MAGDNDRARSLLAAALKARNPETRKEAVKALRLFDGQNDPDVPVRVAAVGTLGERKNGDGDRTAENRLERQGLPRFDLPPRRPCSVFTIPRDGSS